MWSLKVITGAHSVAPYITVMGKSMLLRNDSISWLRAAPPTTAS